MSEGVDGTLWVVTRSLFLYGLPPSTRIPERVEARSDNKPVFRSAGHRVVVDRTGRLFTQCPTEPGQVGDLSVLDPLASVCLPVPDVRLNRLLSAGEANEDGSVIVAAGAGLIDGREQTRVIRWHEEVQWSTILDAPTPRDLVVDDAGQIWVATYGGLFVLSASGQLLHAYLSSQVDPSSLSDNRVNAVMKARDGSIWVATHDGVTVFRRNAGSFRTIRSRPGDSSSLSDPRVNAILETRDGTVWIGTSNGLNRRLPYERDFERVMAPDQVDLSSGTQRRVWSLLEAEDGTLLIGTAAAGLHRLDPGTMQFDSVRAFDEAVEHAWGPLATASNRLPVTFMGRDRTGQTWIGTARTVVQRSPTGHFGALALRDSSGNTGAAMVNVMYHDRSGVYWVGNDDGVHELDPVTGKLRMVGKPGVPGQGPGVPVVWTLAESDLNPGALWIGTIGGGLSKLDRVTGEFTWYTVADGLPSNTIYGILVDDDGLLWVSTTRGLARFNPVSGLVERFTRHDGLHDDEFDLMAYHRGARTGRMWFGGPSGVTEFHPDSVGGPSYSYPAQVSGVRVQDTLIPGLVAAGDTLRLHRKQNSISFLFSAPDVVHAGDIGYKFRLSGYDELWRTSDANVPEVSYTRLPPGRYVFELTSQHLGTDVDAPLTRLHVWIEPAIWQTLWFRIAVALLSVGSFAWTVAWLQRRRHRLAMEAAEREIAIKRLLADREAQERARLAREIHDGPIQTLYSVNHRLEEGKPANIEASRRDVQDLASELRAICEQLRPALVTNLGLEGALRARLRTMARMHPGLDLSLSFDPGCSSLDDDAGHACYRMVEEALSNVVQHARATRVEIILECAPGQCSLSIVDNGQGFSPPTDWLELAKERHYGLVGLRERADMLGGSCRILSAPGSGTRIEVTFPVP
jgi:signal transduction histidine kinase/ligand-binding sensor domain-containing protein